MELQRNQNIFYKIRGNRVMLFCDHLIQQNQRQE
jgi:hypothetical protein